MNRLHRVSRAFHSLGNAHQWKAYFSANRKTTFDAIHLLAAGEWLLRAQRVWGARGFGHSYSLVEGWLPPYPETTGYIIPTLYRLYDHFDIPEFRDSALSATAWLVRIQNDEGAYCDLNGIPQVFDTGQILTGLNEVIVRENSELVRAAALRAGQWLASAQQPDGSFTRHAYLNRPHAYYSRVGAAMLRTGRLLSDEGIYESGRTHLEWVLQCQKENGFFEFSGFDDTPAYLHTIVYVMEGLLDAEAELQTGEFLQAALRFSEPFLKIASDRDLILRSQYQEDYSVANAEKCVTGLAQWAGVCFRLARTLNRKDYFEEGLKTLFFLKSKQLFSVNADLHGALPGSVPIWGKYFRFSFPNWGVKFFVDAILEKMEVSAFENIYTR